MHSPILVSMCRDVTAIVMFFGSPMDGNTHSFFSYSCCHDDDCRIALQGVVKVTPEGYLVLGRTRVDLLPYDDKRIKIIPPDQEQAFYVCRNAGDPDGFVLCLYVPQGGS